MNTRLIYCFVFCLSMPFGLATSASGFSVEDAYMRAMPPGRTATAAYLSVTNNHDKACSIIGGSTAVAAKLEIHQQLMSDGMMRMRPMKKFTIPPGEVQKLEPGGLHIMLMRLSKPLKEGAIFEVQFDVDKGDHINFSVVVGSMGQMLKPSS